MIEPPKAYGQRDWQSESHPGYMSFAHSEDVALNSVVGRLLHHSRYGPLGSLLFLPNPTNRRNCVPLEDPRCPVKSTIYSLPLRSLCQPIAYALLLAVSEPCREKALFIYAEKSLE